MLESRSARKQSMLLQKLAELEDRLLVSYTCNNTCNLSSSSPEAGPRGKEEEERKKKHLFPHTLSPLCASEGLRPRGLDYTTQGFITSQDLKFTCENKQKICNGLRKDVKGFLNGKGGLELTSKELFCIIPQLVMLYW